MGNTKEVSIEVIGQACTAIEKNISSIAHSIDNDKKVGFKDSDWLIQDKYKEIDKLKQLIKDLRGF